MTSWKRTTIWTCGLTLMALAATPRPASATLLVPGATVVPTQLNTLPNDPPPGTLAASNSATLVSTTGDFTATLIAAVYLTAGGTHDFYYQVINSGTSTASIDDVNNSTFSPIFATDVFYRTDGSALSPNATAACGAPCTSTMNFSDGNLGATPLFASRDSTGTPVAFQFSAAGQPPTTKINPGETSRVLVIKTNASGFTSGFTSLQNGGTATFDTFQPAGIPIPEPGSILLLGTGLLGVASLARRRLARQSK